MKTVYRNAKIYTVNSRQPWAQEMLVDNGKIIYIGETTGNKYDNSVDCGGRFIMPSFTDSHTHPGFVSKSMWHIELPDFETAEDLMDYIRTYGETHTKEEIPFLFFEYYPTGLFGTEGPVKEMLDSCINDRPCLVEDASGHMTWVNSKLLDLMEVDKNTQDPSPVSVYMRNSEGDPTGWIKEGAWFQDIDKAYRNMNWYPPDGLAKENIAKVYDIFKGYGCTGIFCAFLEGEQEIKSTYELDMEGRLNLYYDASVRCDDLKDLKTRIRYLRDLQRRYTTDHITVNTMKLFIDGTMADGSAGLLEPMSNDPEQKNCGRTNLSKEDLIEYFTICNEEGIDVHIHTVGDRSFRNICDAVELIKKQGDWRIQVVIAHCGVVNRQDVKRPAQLGITLNLTPHWMGGVFGDSAVEYLGMDRWINQGCYKKLVFSGATVALSSDTISYEELNRSYPLFGIQIANTRVDIEYPLDPKKYPESICPPKEECLPLQTLIEGYTLGSAKQLHIEDKTGSLETGKSADFIILSENPFEVKPENLHKIEVESVFFEGIKIKG